MNTRQIQYAIKLAECLNFSQVAEQLGISQPALSKQILNLEKELGVKLFDRNTVPMTLTPAGEYFIQASQELLSREDQLLRSMEDFKSGERGKLVIGVSPFRSLYLMPRIVQKVREKYPGVQIVLHEAGSDQLRKEAAEGRYDFAVVNLPVDESVLEVDPIEVDTLVLAVPKTLLGKIASAADGQLPQIDFKACKALPFVVVGRSQEMRRLFDRVCAAADLRPIIAAEVVGVTTAWAMARAGIGATLLPLQFIENMGIDDTLALFALKDSVRSRQLALVTKKGQYLSQYAQYAMQLLVNKN